MEMKELIATMKLINERINERNTDMKENLLLLKSMKLSEEVGELYNEILGHIGYIRKEKHTSFDNLKDELADVVITVFIMAEELWVDMEEVLEHKLKTINSRFNIK